MENAPSRARCSGRWAVLTGVAAIAALLMVASTPGKDAAAQQPPPAMHPVIFTGGTIGELVTLAGDGIIAVWAVVDGEFIGYVEGAPAVVNEAFFAAFTGGQLPAHQPLLLLMAPGFGPVPSVLSMEALEGRGTDLMISAYSSRLVRGDFASVTAQTGVPRQFCTIQYSPPAGTTDAAADLTPQMTDEAGAAFWMWQVPTLTTPGTARVSVSCGGESVTEFIEIE